MKGYIATYSGAIINPLHPNLNSIRIEDIAKSLSQQCRFTGHVSQFYSVATHSVLASILVPEKDALWALLHDASEAYLSDIARPVKHGLGFGEAYREVETNLMSAICQRFGLDEDMPETVHWADDMLLRTEARDLMPPEFFEIETDWADGPFLDFEIEAEPPLVAEGRFLQEFSRLTA
jgi:uncharacterized protein